MANDVADESTLKESAEKSTVDATNGVESTPEPKGGADESTESADSWRKRYEAMRKHSREWEQRAKAHEKELAKLKEATDLERVGRLEAELVLVENERDCLAVAAEFGLPVDVAKEFLHGEVADMRGQAEALKGLMSSGGRAEAPAQGHNVDERAQSVEWAREFVKKHY